MEQLHSIPSAINQVRMQKLFYGIRGIETNLPTAHIAHNWLTQPGGSIVVLIYRNWHQISENKNASPLHVVSYEY